MTTTLEAVKATQEKLAGMIAELEAKAPRQITLAAATIELQQGEFYAGIVLGPDGVPTHHLVLLAGDAGDITWDNAMALAAASGGELPTRREQALLFANLKDKFEERYYWSCEQRASDPSYAWSQNFYDGDQTSYRKTYEGRARAVRRVAI
jgi:hypothetical protein